MRVVQAYSWCKGKNFFFNTIICPQLFPLSRFHSFNVIAATFYEHYDDILNFYVNRSSNAAAESFNAKIKAFRASLRGIVDEKFFLFRLAKIYAYPH